MCGTKIILLAPFQMRNIWRQIYPISAIWPQRIRRQ